MDHKFTVAAAADTVGDALISNCLIRAVKREWPFETYNDLYNCEPLESIHNKTLQHFPLIKCDFPPPHFPRRGRNEFVSEYTESGQSAMRTYLSNH